MTYQQLYIVFEKDEGNFGKILKTGAAPSDVSYKQGKSNQFVLLDCFARDNVHKIQVDGWDRNGGPINPRVVDKTPAEIEAEKALRQQDANSEEMIAVPKSEFDELIGRVERLEQPRA